MLSDHANRELSRVRERSKQTRYLLKTRRDFELEGDDIGQAWRMINDIFYGSAPRLEGWDHYRMGNRFCVPRMSLVIRKWKNKPPMELVGYRSQLRMNRLKRNYWNEESISKCRAYMDQRPPKKHSSHGIYFGTGKKKTPPCLVGGYFNYFPGFLNVDFFIRSSEITKTLLADLHFFSEVMMEAVPPWMRKTRHSVRIQIGMAFNMAQWFPLWDMIAPGLPMNPEKYRFHKMCMRSLKLAQNMDYLSKWRPERRILNTVRKEYDKYETDDQGRIVAGPSYFPR